MDSRIRFVLLPFALGLLLLYLPAPWVSSIRLNVHALQLPVSVPLAQVKARMAGWFHLWGVSWDAPQRVTELEKENTDLRSQLVQLNDQVATLEHEVTQIEALRELLSSSQFVAQPAIVVSRNYESFFDEVTINVGSRQGLDVGMGVVQGHQVLGKITEVGPFTAKVALITNPNCKIAAKILRNQKQGLLSGRNPGSGLGCQLKYIYEDNVAKKAGAVAVGDKVVTSGTDPAFVPGMPIGTVTKTLPPQDQLFYDVQLKPWANMSTLYSVLVLKRIGESGD